MSRAILIVIDGSAFQKHFESFRDALDDIEVVTLKAAEEFEEWHAGYTKLGKAPEVRPWNTISDRLARQRDRERRRRR